MPLEAMPRERWSRALLWAALAVALVRFVRLGEWGLWIDEVFTLADARNRGDAVNPLGYALWNRWLELLGPAPTELELRLPAALLGILCVPLSAYAARPLLGARGSAAAALLLAASSWHVYWSQNARFYTLAMALSLLGAGLALRGVLRGGAVRTLVGWLVASAACLAHPSAALVLPGLIAGPVLIGSRPGAARGRLRVMTFAAVAIAAVLGGLWAYDVLWTWDRKKGIGNPLHLLLSSGFYFTPVVGAAALFGLFDTVRRRAHPAAVAVVVVLAGFAVAGAASLFVRMSAQYVFVLLPWVTMLAVAPLQRIYGTTREATLPGLASVAWTLVLVAPLLANTSLYLTSRAGERPKWREAYAVVAAERRAGDLVLGMAAPVGQFYLDPGCQDPEALTALEYLNPYTFDAPLLAAHRGRRAWYVVNHERFAEWPADRRDEIRRMLEEECRLVADFPLEIESRDLSVQVFLRER